MTERITSRQNKTIKYVRALSGDKALRQEKKEFVCDGEKLLSEAIAENADIKRKAGCTENIPRPMAPMKKEKLITG